MSLAEQQIADLKTRTDFLWCKLSDVAQGDVLDRIGSLETGQEVLEAEVDDLQVLTEPLEECGVLTLDCEDSASPSASASFSASVSPGEMDLLIGGDPDPDATGTLIPSGLISGRPSWSTDGNTFADDLINWVQVRWFGASWVITYQPSGGASPSTWYSEEDVATPDLVTFWQFDVGSAGEPTVTLV